MKYTQSCVLFCFVLLWLYYQFPCWLTWWCHQMETFSTSLDLYDGNPLVTGGFPSQRPVMWSFDVFYDLCLNKWLSKQSRLRCLHAHYDVAVMIWVRSRNCGCLVTWFCYQLIAKPGNKTAAVPWPDPYDTFTDILLHWPKYMIINSWYQTTTKHNKTWTVRIFLGPTLHELTIMVAAPKSNILLPHFISVGIIWSACCHGNI